MMSQQTSYPITCPHCHAAQEVALYDSVNVQTDPELRDALMENRLNAITCRECGFAFRIDKPLLYNDPDQRMLIYWIPVARERIEEGEAQFQATVAELASLVPDQMALPELHLVITRTELVERIFLREAGLNERIIEYIKYMIYTKNLAQLAPQEKILLFNAEDSTADSLCFVVQDAATRRLESVFEYRREAYEAMCEMFDDDEQTASLYEIFPGPYISARALLLREQEAEQVPERER